MLPIFGSRSSNPNGGTSARSGPAGDSISRQRSLADSCGCSRNSPTLFMRALAICAAGRQRELPRRGAGAERIDDERVEGGAMVDATRVRAEPRIGQQVRALQYVSAEARPLALVLQADEHDFAIAGRVRAVGGDGRV